LRNAGDKAGFIRSHILDHIVHHLGRDGFGLSVALSWHEKEEEMKKNTIFLAGFWAGVSAGLLFPALDMFANPVMYRPGFWFMASATFAVSAFGILCYYWGTKKEGNGGG